VLGSASTFTGRYARKLLALEIREKHQRKIEIIQKLYSPPLQDFLLTGKERVKTRSCGKSLLHLDNRSPKIYIYFAAQNR